MMIKPMLKTTQFWGWALCIHALLIVGLYYQWPKSTHATIAAQQVSAAVEERPIETTLVDEQWVEEEVARLEQAEKMAQVEQAQAAQLAAQQAMQLEKLKAEVHQLQQEKVEQADRWAEKAKQLAEEKARAQAKAREQAQAKAKEEAMAALQKEQQAKAAEAKQEAEKKQQAIAALRAKISEEKMAQSAKGDLDESIAKIMMKVSQRWIKPVGDVTHLSCQLSVKVLPNGVVQSVAVAQSSGHALFDRSASTAVMKASPLPLPENRIARQNLREFTFTFYPNKD